jgi:hypothetical protein
LDKAINVSLGQKWDFIGVKRFLVGVYWYFMGVCPTAWESVYCFCRCYIGLESLPRRRYV